MKRHILIAFAMLSMNVAAQTFEDGTGYAAINTYDSWTDSPFRTGKLQGNAKVVDNPHKDKSNPTDKVLAYQRSRWASNIYGVRVDLSRPFDLTPTAKYVHALIHKPKEGRVMCIGLGKQRTNTEQSKEVEQFHVMPTQSIGTGKWFDAVFPVRGAGNIDIYSLVFVTDLESTDALAEDHIAYVDEIIVTDSPAARIVDAYYAIAVDVDKKLERNDFQLSGITLTGNESGAHTIDIDGSSSSIYRKMLDKVVSLKAGESITPSFAHSGRTMNAYIYLDTDDNGLFDVNTSITTRSNPLPAGSELFSYSFMEEKVGEYGFNSAGKMVGRPKRDNMDAPSFTVPNDMKPGLYRMRIKFDMANGEPAGRTGDSSGIEHNGGLIVDFMVNITGQEGMASQNGLNGDLCLTDGTIINNITHTCGKPFTIKQLPAPGFVPGTVTVRYGYHLNGERTLHGNPQWYEHTYPASATNADGLLTIPAEYTWGNMQLGSDFIEQTK